MTSLTKEQASTREKTLRAALLLSLWAPLTTGVAVILSLSTTQLADFVRRTVELIALAVSWGVFRHLERRGNPDSLQRARLETMATFSVGAAMGVSGLFMIGVALSRLSAFMPGGNVYPGLAIATLGLGVNAWFWRRYTRLTKDQYNAIIDAQRDLYRAKTCVDLCVIMALAAVAIAPTHPMTRYVDVLGSIIVSLYLLWTAIRMVRTKGPN